METIPLNHRENNMEFTSFEEALKICMNAEEGSELQNRAAAYAIKHAPPELADKLVKIAYKHFGQNGGGENAN